jgi:hypothetical protein
MDNHAIIRPYQHVVYSAALANFDIDIDIEFEGGISTILISSTIGRVVLYSHKIQRTLDFETARMFYMNDASIQAIIESSKERLAEVLRIL